MFLVRVVDGRQILFLRVKFASLVLFLAEANFTTNGKAAKLSLLLLTTLGVTNQTTISREQQR